MRLAAIVKLAQFPESDTHMRAAGVLAKDKTNAEDEWLKLALQAAGAEAKSGPHHPARAKRVIESSRMTTSR